MPDPMSGWAAAERSGAVGVRAREVSPRGYRALGAVESWRQSAPMDTTTPLGA